MLLAFGALLVSLTPAPAAAQSASGGEQPYVVGSPLGLPVVPEPGTTFRPISPNVKVYGAIFSAESCSYDPVRDLIVVPNRGVANTVQLNDGWVSFLNHDGSVHTPRWIGVQTPDQRRSLSPPLVLHEPLGSEIVNGVLYVADRDGGTSPSDPSVAVIRRFDMKTGRPAGDTRVEKSAFLNDVAVARDGTIYATDTFANQIWRIAPNGNTSVLVEGEPLSRPNGIALDPDGNIVVVNMGDPGVLTFSPDGRLQKTEQAVQAGSDGLVIMPDGTKYVSSVQLGGVSRIRPGQKAELIAENIPNGASMCYDAGANQLVIPMNQNNALAFIRLD